MITLIATALLALLGGTTVTSDPEPVIDWAFDSDLHASIGASTHNDGFVVMGHAAIVTAVEVLVDSEPTALDATVWSDGTTLWYVPLGTVDDGEDVRFSITFDDGTVVITPELQ